jgi:hypothetical protein
MQFELGMVAYAYNPIYSGGGGRKMPHKVSQTRSQNKIKSKGSVNLLSTYLVSKRPWF